MGVSRALAAGEHDRAEDDAAAAGQGVDAHHGDLRRLEPGGRDPLYLNGALAEVDVDHDTLTQSILPLNYNPVVDSFVGVSFGQRMREKAPVDSGIDEMRLFKRALTPIEVGYLQADAVPHRLTGA